MNITQKDHLIVTTAVESNLRESKVTYIDSVGIKENSYVLSAHLTGTSPSVQMYDLNFIAVVLNAEVKLTSAMAVDEGLSITLIITIK